MARPRDPGGSRAPTDEDLSEDILGRADGELGHRPSWLSLLHGAPWRRAATLAACGAAGLLAAVWADARADLLPPAAVRALGITVTAALLWVTEAIPPFATGIAVMAMQIAFLGNPEAGVYATTPEDWERFVVFIGHPLVWLFFGGFVLAAGLERAGLDRRLASALLERVGDRPEAVLGAVMAATFVLSAIMSNTATTAMMLALVAPLLAGRDQPDRFATRLLLGLAAAANLGGMSTLVGSPPNAIAAGVLQGVGAEPRVGFLRWMVLGLPVGVALALGIFAVLAAPLRRSSERVDVRVLRRPAAENAPGWQVSLVSTTLVATVGLWLTGPWHGLPTAVVSFVPIVAFTASGLLGAPDIRGLPFDVLFLIAGGLALGSMMGATGLSAWLLERLPLSELGPMGAALALAWTGAAVSNFMSNTAAANVVVPLAAGVLAGAEVRLAVPVALAASCAMALPVATPPNALIHGTGRLAPRHWLALGAGTGLLGPPLAVAWTALALRAAG